MRRLVASCLVLGLLNSACFDSDLTKAGNILQSAIDQLSVAPGNVKAVLGDAINQLGTLSGTVITQADAAVKDALAEAAGLAGAVLQCQLDSIGVHARDTLIYIKQHILLQQPAPPPTPWVCITNPTVIEVQQTAANGPYTLKSTPLYQIFGFNFREQTLPAINYHRSGGALVAGNVVAAGLHTPYEMDINLQTVNFSGAVVGDYLSVDWSSSATGVNRIVMILDPYQAPPPPPHRTEHFVLSVHANSGLFSGECKDLQNDPLSQFTIGSPWKIDRSQGDASHPGMHEESNNDNQQADNSLRGYNYSAQNDNQVKIVGTICGAGADGPGAIFDRGYAVYETQ